MPDPTDFGDEYIGYGLQGGKLTNPIVTHHDRDKAEAAKKAEEAAWLEMRAERMRIAAKAAQKKLEEEEKECEAAHKCPKCNCPEPPSCPEPKECPGPESCPEAPQCPGPESCPKAPKCLGPKSCPEPATCPHPKSCPEPENGLDPEVGPEPENDPEPEVGPDPKNIPEPACVCN